MKIKFPSFQELASATGEIWSRFPFTLSVSAFLSVFLVLLNHKVFGDADDGTVIRIILATILLIPLGIGIQIRKEVQDSSLTSQVLLYCLSIGLAFYLFRITGSNMADAEILQYILCVAGVHLTACSLPFIGTKFSLSFWHYNRILLTRILIAVFYSGFLFLGLTLALLALKYLLGLEIRDRIYADLAIVLSGIFNTWFFLSGLPNNWKALEEDQDYPKGLKIFSGYVLIPLVLVYLIILYLYAGKVVIQQEWPLTWMGYLVLGFSISGILALLLIWPIRNQSEKNWIFQFNRYYLPLLLPLSVLLFITIGKQISQYGITPNRYILAMTTAWIILIAVFYIWKGFNRIIYVPISLAFVCFFGAMSGPLNLIEVSIRNQKHRLQEILLTNNAICEGKVCIPEVKISTEDLQEIADKLNFLNQNKDSTWMSEYLPETLIDSLKNEGYDASNGNIFVSAFMEKIGDYPGSGYEDGFQNLKNSVIHINGNGTAIHISGYDMLTDFNHSVYNESDVEKQEIYVGEFPVKLYYLPKRNALHFEDPNGDLTEFSLSDSLETWALKWGNPNKSRTEEIRIQSSTTLYQIGLSISNLTIERNKNLEMQIQDIQGKMMIKPK